MKNHIISFLLGVATLLCIGAGLATTDIITVKPATPKSTVVKVIYSSTNVPDFIIPYAKKGYIVKSCTSSGTASWIVILEKY